MYNDEYIITLPYYRNIVDTTKECEIEYESNYSHYDLFRMRTWLQRYIKDITGENIFINLISVETDNKMQFVVNTMKNGVEIQLDYDTIVKIKKFINDIINNKDCLMDLSVIEQLPHYWIQWMLPYVIKTIDEKYKPNIFYLGIVITIDSKEYIDIFNNLYKNVYKELLSMYAEGYIINAESIAHNWDLVNVYDNIYKPTWNDGRFAPVMFEFLMRLLSGDNRLYMFIKPSYSLRYLIAEKINDVTFYDFKVCFTANNLREARRKADLIDKLSVKAKGVVEFGKGLSYELEGNVITSLLT